MGVEEHLELAEAFHLGLNQALALGFVWSEVPALDDDVEGRSQWRDTQHPVAGVLVQFLLEQLGFGLAVAPAEVDRRFSLDQFLDIRILRRLHPVEGEDPVEPRHVTVVHQLLLLSSRCSTVGKREM